MNKFSSLAFQAMQDTDHLGVQIHPVYLLALPHDPICYIRFYVGTRRVPVMWESCGNRLSYPSERILMVDHVAQAKTD